LCEERNVSWSEVDLRWGITADKINEGKLIPIIIEEIKRCKPYFIGILGQRYGYIPPDDEFRRDIIRAYPWLSEYPGRSITEMEIIYGVFENNEKNIPAFFYIKSKQKEMPAPTDDTKSALKQNKLISRIKESNYTWHEYESPDKMGDLVYQDFISYINKIFPQNEQPDNFECENNSQNSYAKSRGSIYIGGKKYFDRIDEFLKSKSRLLIVDGISGSGKTALLANWCLNYTTGYNNVVIFSHFVGATENSTNWAQMITRFIIAAGRYLNLRITIPEDIESLRSEFKKMLSNLNSKAGGKKFIFVIDALNQLENKEGARELLWLPEMVNENIYFILSSLPGTSMEILRGKEHSILSVKSLHKDEQKELIHKYLAQYSKTLDIRLVNKIIANEQARIPLYLLTLLNEIRLFGKYEELEKRLNYYLDSSSPHDLFIKVLERLENDFNNEIPKLVERILSYIYVSRKGIEEAELLDLASRKKGERLPVYFWSPLYLSMESSLINHSGLINFSHEYLRKGVWERYIGNDSNEIKIHSYVSSYYLNKFPAITQRMADELPWHLIRSKQYKRLYDILMNTEFFNWLWKNNRYDLKTYCALLESKPKYSIGNIDKIDFKAFKGNHEYYFNLLTLLYEMSEWDKVRKIAKPIISRVLEEKDWGTFGRLVYTVGQMMLDGGPEEVAQVMEWSKLAKDHSRSLKYRTNLINSLLNLAYGYNDQGKNKIAIKYNNRALKLAQEIGDYEAIYTSYNNNAVIYNNMGKDQKAMDYYSKVMQIGYSTGDQSAVQLAKGNMAWIHFGWGDMETALKLFLENEKAYSDWGEDEGVAFAKYCKAMIYYEMNRIDEAEKLYEEALETYIRINDQSWIPPVTGWLGIIAFEKGKTREAFVRFRKALKMYEKVTDYEYMPSFMADYARILIETGNYKRPIALLKRGEKMANHTNYKPALLDVYIVKTLYFLKTKDFKNARIANNRVKQLARFLKNTKGTIKNLILKYQILNESSKGSRGYKYLDEALALAKSKGFIRLSQEIIDLKANK
jgi:tetratricopeptide (TPR) repeat protein